jgi:hypothetical protein
LVNLPDTNIIRFIGIVVSSISIASTLVLYDALAAGLVPSRELAANRGNILVVKEKRRREECTNWIPLSLVVVPQGQDGQSPEGQFPYER